MKIKQTLRFIMTPGQQLSRRVAFAGAWMLALRVIGRSLGLVRLIVLARLLAPEAFGLVGIALLVIELLRTFTQHGFGVALIQHKGDIKAYLDTAWVVSAIRGLVLGILVFGMAPLAAGYFNAPDATCIIQAMGAVLVIRGFSNSGMIYFSKELQVHKRFIWEISAELVDLAVSVSAALILRNAWALVYGAIASSIVWVIVSYFLHSYRPRLRFDFNKARELFRFGWWVLLSSIVDYIFISVDRIFIGRFLGVVAMGLYVMAHRIGYLVGQEMSVMHTSVVFPAYSKLQDNPDNLRKAFSANMEAIALVAFPIAGGIFVLAPDFVTLVLGEQWVSAIPAMQILGIAAAIYSLLSVSGSLFYGVGKPHLRFLMMGTATFVITVLLLLQSRGLSLTGAAMAVLAGNVVGLLFLIWTSARVLNTGVKDLIRLLISPITVSLLMSIILVLFKHVVGQIDIGGFILMICLGVLVYTAFALLLWRFFRSGPVQILTLFKGGE